MKGDNDQIVAFLSLEEFAVDRHVNDAELVRVQPISRVTSGKPEHRMIQWIVLVSTGAQGA